MFKAASKAAGGFLDEFSCDVCGSPSIAVPEALDGSAKISCGRCGCFVATWSEFCQEVDHLLRDASSRVRPAGEVWASAR